MNNLEKIQSELQALGYDANILQLDRSVVAFDYKVENGAFEGQTVKLGFAMDDGGDYPEYPPHWIYISPPVPVSGEKTEYVENNEDQQERKWIILSRPPKDIWDGLNKKGMKAYLEIHIRRFWEKKI